MLFLEKLQIGLHSLGHEKFRAKQILDYVYKKGIADFDEMKILPAPLRAELKKKYHICSLEIMDTVKSADNSAVKFLLKTQDNHKIETVIMRFKDGRNTACISSQIGCKLGCRFCATGRLGYFRDLTAEEICDQVLIVNNHLLAGKEKLTNIVYMGMGEPFLNYDNVVESLKILNDKNYFSIGVRNITVSTAGIATAIVKFSSFPLKVNLAISLHAPDQQTREKIMPVAKMYGLDELMEACRIYTEKTGRRITYEYVMLKNINDGRAFADKLGRLLKDTLCHVNLIPYNETDITGMERSTRRKTEEFVKTLESFGIPVTVRVSLGKDIYAACGQLANKK